MITLFKLMIIFLVSLSYGFDLSYLKNNERESVPPFASESSIWFFYKPDCPVCYAQVKELKCIKSPHQIITAGFGGERSKLRREARKLNISTLNAFRSYFIDDNTFKLFPLKKNLSPQLIIFKKQKIVKRFIGLTKCEKILLEFSRLEKDS